jgi:hypothetical protein
VKVGLETPGLGNSTRRAFVSLQLLEISLKFRISKNFGLEMLPLDVTDDFQLRRSLRVSGLLPMAVLDIPVNNSGGDNRVCTNALFFD